MIQEPISDLEKMLEEPVEELAMGRGPLLGQQVVRSAFSQENRKRFPRLTVRLVALEPSGSYTPAPEANSFTPTPEVNDEDLEDYDDWSDETPEPGVNSYPYTPAPDSNELWWFDRALSIRRSRSSASSPRPGTSATTS